MGISLISPTADRRDRHACREALAQTYQLAPDALDRLRTSTFSQIDKRLKEGETLSYDETYSGMMHVLAATNRCVFDAFTELDLCQSREHAIAMAAAFLQGMACKEAFAELHGEEIAGLIEAAIHDLVVRIDHPQPLFEMCGMGGDRGICRGGKWYKTINATTLTALTLSAMGIPTIKHGSGKNTSVLGSTDLIRELNIKHLFGSQRDMDEHLAIHSFVYIDAAVCKSVHDLSSLMRVETINHLVGPLALPVTSRTPIFKMLGTNNKVSPLKCAEAMIRLNMEGVTSFKNVAVVCGFESEDASTLSFRDSVLDELSSGESEVALVIESQLVGSFRVHPRDFGIDVLPDIWLPNDADVINHVNRETIAGRGLTAYLAMNVALALYLRDLKLRDFCDANPWIGLPDGYEIAFDFIKSGRLASRLAQLSEAG